MFNIPTFAFSGSVQSTDVIRELSIASARYKRIVPIGYIDAGRIVGLDEGDPELIFSKMLNT